MPRADDAGGGRGWALRWSESALAGAGVSTFKSQLCCGEDHARVPRGEGGAYLAGVTGGGDSARAPSCRERVVSAREEGVAACVPQVTAME